MTDTPFFIGDSAQIQRTSELEPGESPLLRLVNFGERPNSLERVGLPGKIQNELETTYGVSVKEKNGKYQFSYRANGQDNIVAESKIGVEGLKEGQQLVAKYAAEKIAELELRYKVRFAVAGEAVERSRTYDERCRPVFGAMANAAQPTLGQLRAAEEALMRSEPSQIDKSTGQGMKIYFLEGQIYPPVYGGKPVLGIFRHADKDGKRALIITADGGKLPPLEKDMKAGEKRYLAWAIAHEFTHNSQEDAWPDGMVPAKVGIDLGWKAKDISRHNQVVARHFQLEGKQGELFKHGAPGCQARSRWYSANEEGLPLNEQGQSVGHLDNAKEFSDDQVQAQAKVRPFTYYFMNPREMHSEALTGFRMGEEKRARLLKESPRLYEVAKTYDQEELARHFGVDKNQRALKLRSLDGPLVDRSDAHEKVISDFENRHRH